MAYYRLYFMDGLSGHVTTFLKLDAETDEHAIGKAEGHRIQVAMELWCERRKVKRWPPDFVTTIDSADGP